jgi:integrase
VVLISRWECPSALLTRRRHRLTEQLLCLPHVGIESCLRPITSCPHLPSELQPVIEFTYLTGWRLASEVLPLEWRNVDLKAGEVRIDAGASKSGEPRVIFMSATLRTVLEAQQRAHEKLKKAGHITPLVFWRMTAESRGGVNKPQAIVSLNKAWRKACREAGVPGKIPHDLRRTAIRNMIRAGISQ